MTRRFETTSWTLVLEAREGDSTHSREALARLCQAYWPPLYTFVRHRGYSPDDARDLTQSYFAELLEKDFLNAAKPEAGRFRSFLLTSLSHLLAHEDEKARALKRGAGRVPISLDADQAEKQYRILGSDEMTPEKAFERKWALTVLDRVLEQIRREFTNEGKARQFDILKVFLTGEAPGQPYRQIAADLETSEAAVKMAVRRLRKRFGRGLKAEISETVADPARVDEEVRHLLQVVSE